MDTNTILILKQIVRLLEQIRDRLPAPAPAEPARRKKEDRA